MNWLITFGQISAIVFSALITVLLIGLVARAFSLISFKPKVFARSPMSQTRNHLDALRESLLQGGAPNIQERAELIRNGLAAVSTAEKDILLRFHLKSEGVDELSRALGLSHLEAAASLSRARKRLAKVLREVYQENHSHMVLEYIGNLDESSFTDEDLIASIFWTESAELAEPRLQH